MKVKRVSNKKVVPKFKVQIVFAVIVVQSLSSGIVTNVRVYDVVLLRIINVRLITQWHKHFLSLSKY